MTLASADGSTPSVFDALLDHEGTVSIESDGAGSVSFAFGAAAGSHVTAVSLDDKPTALKVLSAPEGDAAEPVEQKTGAFTVKV